MTRIIRDGAFYVARPIIDGRKLYVRAKTKGEVDRQIAALKEGKRLRKLGLPQPEQRRAEITYGQLCDLLLDGYPHKPQSKTALTYALKHSRNRFEKTLLRNVTFEATRAWYAQLGDLSPTTKRHAVTAMRQALNFGIEAEYCDANPAKKISRPEPSERKHPFESWEEVSAAAEAFENQRYRSLVIFVCSTGLRPQEWRALTWGDLDLGDNSLTITHTIQAGTRVAAGKTRGSLRLVELPAVAVEALKSLPRPLDRSQLVFPGPRGGFLDLAAWRRTGEQPGPWTAALARAGLAYRSPDQMRHTAATLWLADGAAIEWIAKQLGHTTTSTTERHYRKWLRSDRRNVSIIDTAHAERATATGQKTDSAS